MKKLSFNCNEFSGVDISVIVENDTSKEIRIAMEKDSQMKEHKAPGSIMVQVLKGKIDFGIKDEIYVLNELDMIFVDPNIPHSLKAQVNSIIRLSLSKNDSSSRVFDVLKN